MPFAVIFPAAGRSSRFGGEEKKPFVALDHRPIWLRSVEMFVNRADVVQTLIVVAPEDLSDFKRRFGLNASFLNVTIVAGGAERFESVANALEQLVPEADFVAVHDAVRPLVSAKLIDTVFAAAQTHGAALPGLPIPDTIKRVDDTGQVTETIPRAGLWQAQTPQVARRDWLIEAYRRRAEVTAAVTDDAQLLEAVGKPVRMVLGEARNFKITTKADLTLAEMFLRPVPEPAGKPRHPFADDEFS